MKKILLTALFFLSAFIMFGQSRTVTGKVTSADGKPVPFATVTVKGTSTAVSADENGNFGNRLHTRVRCDLQARRQIRQVGRR